MASPVLRCAGVTKAYQLAGRPVPALRGVDLVIETPGFCAIMGQSGSGKSTLLHLLGALDRPDSGTIEVAGRPIHDLSEREATLFRRRGIGIVFQQFNLIPTLTARDNIELPGVLAGEPVTWLRQRSDELLARLGITQRAVHRPDALSGGEQQRVAIARALLFSPPVLLADEPTGNLDSQSAEALWSLLEDLAREGMTVVMVTHEPAAAAHCREVFVLSDGRVTGQFSPGEGEHGAGDVAALAISAWSGRGSRAALLVGAVTLSAALIVTVACAMASIHAALTRQIESTVGRADLRVLHSGTGKDVPGALLDRVRGWPELALASGRLTAPLAIRFEPAEAVGADTRSATALGNGLADSPLAPAPDLIAGRMPAAEGEIAVDALLAELLSPRATEQKPGDGWRLGATPGREAARYGPGAPADRLRLGDRVKIVKQLLPTGAMPFTIPILQTPAELTVVGVTAQPPLGGRAQAYLTFGGLSAVAGTEGGLTQIDAIVRPGFDPEAVATAHRPELASLDPGLLLQTTARVTSGAEANMQSSQLGFILATFMAFLSASFIVLTGMTTSVTERQRELGILRCIGAERGLLMRVQVVNGLVLGTCGATLGLPLGLLIAWGLAYAFRAQLTTGLIVPPGAVALAAAGAVLSGAAGAAWPAWRAGRVAPLAAVGVRAEVSRPRGLAWISTLGLLGLALQFVIVGAPSDGQVIFWGYATAGLPLMFTGYFLLGVPAILILTRGLGGPLSRGLGLPAGLLAGTVRATPYRHGLTAGALMGGLALMVAIWINGGAVLRDWLGRINFPDAFVSGPALPAWAQQKLDSMTDLVEATCAITLHQVETNAFGVHSLQHYKSTFIAFEPRAFFAMMQPQWVQGDPVTAIPRLEAGGAVIVAKEFQIAQDLDVGDTFTCRSEGQPHSFEIVGVVTSPGLEVVSKFFNIGEDYTDQSLHAVFGTRDDLRRLFHSDATQLIQIDLREGVDDDEAVARIRRELFGAGILDAGSGRHVKDMLRSFALGALGVLAAVALVAMLVACFGVAGLIVAGIEARRFEFGVLRAVGASRGLLTRLVLGEVLLVGLTASIMGVLMGIQGAWAGQRLDRLLMGIDVHLRPPLGLISASCALLMVLCLLAALPAVVRLARQRPRDLLGAVRG